MSKVNIAKIAKDVGICSENLIGISESLISISKRYPMGREWFRYRRLRDRCG